MATEQQELTEIIDLSLIADILQIINFWLNMKQVSSDALGKGIEIKLKAWSMAGTLLKRVLKRL